MSLPSFVLLAVSVTLFACTPTTSSLPAALPTTKEFAQQEVWNDGRAEIATYDAVRVVYGKPRRHTTTMITVKEDFNSEFDVKTDTYDRRDLLAVMKINLASTIQTDAYPYHYLTSMFFRRDDAASVHKVVSTSQEWCGTTFKRFSGRGDSLVVMYDSYWDGEGNGATIISRDLVIEDQLLYSLRSISFRQGMTFSARVIPSIITNKAKIAKPQTYTFSVMEDVYDPSSETMSDVGRTSCWRIDMKSADSLVASYWFSMDSMHYLVRYRHSDGRQMTLQKIQRDDYWSKE